MASWQDWNFTGLNSAMVSKFTSELFKTQVVQQTACWSCALYKSKILWWCFTRFEWSIHTAFCLVRSSQSAAEFARNVRTIEANIIQMKERKMEMEQPQPKQDRGMSWGM